LELPLAKFICLAPHPSSSMLQLFAIQTGDAGGRYRKNLNVMAGWRLSRRYSVGKTYLTSTVLA
jgi:hypothetical protein